MVDRVVVLGPATSSASRSRPRGSRDLLTISLGLRDLMAAIPLVGVWGAVLVAWSVGLRPRPAAARSSACSTVPARRLAAGAAGARLSAARRRRRTRGDSFPDVLVPDPCRRRRPLRRSTARSSRGRRPAQQGVARSRYSTARWRAPSLAYLGYGLFGLSLAVLWDRRAMSGRRPPCSCSAAAVRRPLGVRAVRRGAAGLRPHRARR